jgi:hypothetical protein
MNRLTHLGLALALATCLRANAQSLEDLNLQIHGYATQGFLYTDHNNIFTTQSSDGSPAWTEAVVNLTAQPIPKLRIGVQARYYLLGNIGDKITLDWAAADYKVNDLFGVRFGKVKTPSGLYNEVQDIAPSYLWALLPQSIYPIGSRNSVLAHYGGVVYGTVNLPGNAGKLEYRAWGGERVISSDDGVFTSEREAGLLLPEGLRGPIVGAALHWKTPLQGLTLGASAPRNGLFSSPLVSHGNTGWQIGQPNVQPTWFAHYEHARFMAAYEGSRLPVNGTIQLASFPTIPIRLDHRGWYAMATMTITPKLSAGIYHSQAIDHQAPLGPARYQKDWTMSARYDVNPYLYLKAEEHLIQGTLDGFDAMLNPNGLQPGTHLTILKVGVSF